MSEKKDSVKTSKLDNAFDYIGWNQWKNACLHSIDFVLAGLRKPPDNSDERETVEWDRAQIISKESNVIYVSSQSKFWTIEIIDDQEKAAYDL